MKTICNKTKLKMNVTRTNLFALFLSISHSHTHYHSQTSLISKFLCNLTIFRMHVLNVLSRQKWSLLCSRSIYIVKWLGLLSQRNQSKLRMYTVELTFKLNTQKLTAMVAVSKSPLSSAKWFYLHFISVFFRL